MLAAWTLVAAVAYLYRIDVHSLWLDEVMSLEVAVSSWAEKWRFFQRLPEQHPLYYLLLGQWLELGRSELAVRSFSAVWAVGGGWLVYLLARRLFRRRVAALSVGLLLLSPFWLYYAQEARMYTLLGFLAVASHLLFLRWRHGGGRGSLVGYVAAGVLGSYTHLFFLFVPAAHAIFALWERRDALAGARKEVLAAVGIYAAYVPWAWVILGNMPEGQAWKGARHVVLGLPYTLFRFSVGYSEIVPEAGWKEDVWRLVAEHGLEIAAVTAVFGSLLVAGCAAAARRGREGRFVLVGGIVPVVGMFVLSVVTVVVGERYLVVVFPLFVILLALGVERLLLEADGMRGRVIGGLVVGSALFLSVKSLAGYYTPGEFGKEKWREAADFVAERARAGDAVVFHADHVEAPFRYYYGRTGGAELATSDTAAEGGGREGRRIWLVISHAPADSRCLETVLRFGDRGEVRVESLRSYPEGAGVKVLLLNLPRAETVTERAADAADGLALDLTACAA